MREPRIGRRASLVTLLVVTGLLPGVALHAQAGQERADSVLTETARTVAGAWAAGKASGLAPHLSVEGIRLHLNGPARTSTPPRQAIAAIGDFLSGYAEGEARISRAVVAGGTDDRGFVEIHWTARVTGTSETVEHTLFLSLAKIEESWRVEELRLLR